MMKIDHHTVKKLELMAPGVSREDARTVHGWVLSGEVLGEFSEAERSRMWERLKQFDGLIPSLYTFFRDVEYLQPCAHAVKRLVSLSKHSPTLRFAMTHHYVRPPLGEGECLIQTSEFRFEHRPSTGANHLELAYRQVWLYAMRYYPSMAKDPESDNLLAKAGPEKADETVVYDMAVLAQKLGFTSPLVREIINRSPDRQIAQDCLLKARKPDRFEYSADVFERLVHRIVECFAAARPLERPLPADSVLNFSAALKARSGLPSTQTQKQDRRFLFIDRLHTSAVTPTDTVSTWYVRRCVYFAFFGRTSSHPSRVAADTTPRSADSLSPLFVPDDELGSEVNMQEDIDMEGPVNNEGQLQRDAEPAATEPSRLESDEAAEAAEQERLRREAENRAAAELECLRREEERAAAEAAEQERLQQEADAAEQSRLQREAERAQEQERLQREEAERLAAAAEQERLRREAEERAIAAAMEEERVRKEAEERTATEAAEEARREAEEQAAQVEQERVQREAEEQAREQERLQREEEDRRAAAAEERAAEERAAAETADRERLQQEADEQAATAAALEEERIRKEVEARAVAEEAHLRREAEEQAAQVAEQAWLQQAAEAAEQSRLHREAQERLQQEEEERQAVVAVEEEQQNLEDERVAKERALALAQLEHDASIPADAGPVERASSTTQVDLPLDVPSLIARPREGADPDHSLLLEPNESSPPLSTDDNPASASGTVPDPVRDMFLPPTATAELETIPEEVDGLRPIPPTTVEGFRQWRKSVAQRRQQDQAKVRNARRAPEESQDSFIQTRSAEGEDLFDNEESAAVATSPGFVVDPPLPFEGASETTEPVLVPEASPTNAEDPIIPQPPPIPTARHARRKSKPSGIVKARRSTHAARNATTRSPAPSMSFGPSSAQRLTQLDLAKSIDGLPAWSGEPRSQSQPNSNPASTQETVESPPTALSRLWRGRRRNVAGDVAQLPSARRPADPRPRDMPLPPRNPDAGTMIFRAWKGGQWQGYKFIKKESTRLKQIKS